MNLEELQIIYNKLIGGKVDNVIRILSDKIVELAGTGDDENGDI